MLLSQSSLSLPWLAVTVAVLPLTIALYRLYLHPLAGVPGPRLAAVTDLWHAHQLRRGKLFALELHAKYGPVVRIGPNEVMFNSKEAHDIIYRAGSPFVKSGWYWITKTNWGTMDWLGRWHLPDTLNFLSENNLPRYKMQRRYVGQIYSPANLKKHESAIDRVLQRHVQRMKGLQGKKIDLLEWIHILIIECLSEITISGSPGMIEEGSDRKVLDDSYDIWRLHSVLGHFPVLVYIMYLGKLLYGLIPLFLGIRVKYPANMMSFYGWVMTVVNPRVEAMEHSEDYKDRKDLMDDLICLHKEKPEFNQRYAINMVQTNFGGGHETISSAMVSTIFFLSQHPQAMKRVYEEASTLGEAPSMDSCTDLKYTQACFKEALRLVPVIAMNLPRVNPASGFELNGQYFPPGTVVGCNPWALHRNTGVFGDDAADFRPERWIDSSSEKLRAMERTTLAFGGDSRTCPGRNLAELIMSKTLPVLVKEFDIETASSMNIEDMQYCFMSVLTGIDARFVPRAE